MEAEPSRLLSFLKTHDYGCRWDLDVVQQFCIPIRVEREGELLAYVWATWSAEATLDFHACSSRRLWLDRSTLARLFVAAELFGADTLTVTPVGDNAPAIRRLLTHLGFEQQGDRLTRRIDLPNGGYVLPA